MQSFDITSKDHDTHEAGKIIMVNSGTGSFDDMYTPRIDKIAAPPQDGAGGWRQSSKKIILLSEARQHRQRPHKSLISIRNIQANYKNS